MRISEIILDTEAKIRTDPYNPLHHIALAKAYLEEGLEDKARNIVAIRRRMPSKNSEVHYEWGQLCEELGMARQARESFEQSIALDPDNPDYHLRLALLSHEKGAWERALKHLEKALALSPENPEARRLLSSLYLEMGFQGSSQAVRRSETQRTSDPSVTVIPAELTSARTALLQSLFQGREEGYSEYHVDHVGNMIPSFRGAILEAEQIAKHIRGEITLGVYPLRADRTLKCAAIRARIPRRRLIENLKNKGYLVLLEEKMDAYAKELRNCLREEGLPSYLEDPGDRGRRIWFFLEEFIPMDLAERFFNAALDKVRTPGMDLCVDMMLGLEAVGLGKKEQPIMLPLGINCLTGKRCFFLNEEGQAYEDQLLFIEKVRVIRRDQIQHFLKRPDRKLAPTHTGRNESLEKIETKCAVVAEIIRKARSGRNLRSEEKVVIYFTLGFLQDAERILHDLFEACPDYRPQKVDRVISRLRTNPISCPKIRMLLPELTAYLTCNCAFKAPAGGYPSPLLHTGLRPISTKTMEEPAAYTEIARRYDFVCRRIGELTKEKEDLQRRLGDGPTKG